MIEAMKQALNVLENKCEATHPAITALRQAIQEEALRNVARLGQEIEQEWIGLTDEEINGLWEMAQMFATPKHFYLLVEAKLKEKNT